MKFFLVALTLSASIASFADDSFVAVKKYKALVSRQSAEEDFNTDSLRDQCDLYRGELLPGVAKIQTPQLGGVKATVGVCVYSELLSAEDYEGSLDLRAKRIAAVASFRIGSQDLDSQSIFSRCAALGGKVINAEFERPNRKSEVTVAAGACEI